MDILLAVGGAFVFVFLLALGVLTWALGGFARAMNSMEQDR